MGAGKTAKKEGVKIGAMAGAAAFPLMGLPLLFYYGESGEVMAPMQIFDGLSLSSLGVKMTATAGVILFLFCSGLTGIAIGSTLGAFLGYVLPKRRRQ
jgi:hypothetical protein